jgi:RNA polymerase sigma factor (sigma-70 family)
MRVVDYGSARDYYLRFFAARERRDPAIDSEDAAQEALLLLYAAITRGNTRRLRRLLSQIAHQHWYDLDLQANRRDQLAEIITADECDVSPAPESHVFPMITIEIALRPLTTRAREALFARRVLGYTQKEIAASMRISQHTVEQHLQHAYRTLLNGETR